MSDELTGKALMKAVAETVGWTEYATYQPLDFNWAITACEAGGVKSACVNFAMGVFVDGIFSQGCSPESLCHALLAAIEARKEQ